MKKQITTSEYTQDDFSHMRRALSLAKRAWGRTSPNPLVGAVVVRDNTIIGEGYHHQAGHPHAEIEALSAAGSAANGSTVYVTLEPCSTSGRTPPCTQALMSAGVGRVIAATLDPNPSHSGRGIDELQANGIATSVGLLEEDCRKINESFFTWITCKRPFVILKMAMTLDGKIATADGQSKWITGAAARRQVQKLRQWADAVMVGGETILKDDPELSVRSPRSWPYQPRRLIWTRRSEFPAELKIWDKKMPPPEFIKPESPREWHEILQRLGREQVTALLIEGGGELAAATLAAGIVDKVMFFIAPKILGGRDSRPVIGGENIRSLGDAVNLDSASVSRIGNDILVTGYPTNNCTLRY